MERQERRKAEELYEIAKEEKSSLERIVAARAEEISTLEERLVEATRRRQDPRGHRGEGPAPQGRRRRAGGEGG